MTEGHSTEQGQCSHLPTDLNPPRLSGTGCFDCEAAGEHDWFHLRFCQTCGHVGCCDQSPRRHARRHYHEAKHPIIRSYEPDEDWWWCFADRVMLELDEAPPAPSHD